VLYDQRTKHNPGIQWRATGVTNPNMPEVQIANFVPWNQMSQHNPTIFKIQLLFKWGFKTI
jgi:hypothetical protein